MKKISTNIADRNLASLTEGQVTKVMDTYLSIKMNKHATGEIWLSEIGKETGLSKPAIINYLRNTPLGTFVAGRRTHPSRFLFGQKELEFLSSRVPEYLIKRATEVAPQVLPAPVNAPQEVKMTIGGKPVTVQLAA